LESKMKKKMKKDEIPLPHDLVLRNSGEGDIAAALAIAPSTWLICILSFLIGCLFIYLCCSLHVKRQRKERRDMETTVKVLRPSEDTADRNSLSENKEDVLEQEPREILDASDVARCDSSDVFEKVEDAGGHSEAPSEVPEKVNSNLPPKIRNEIVVGSPRVSSHPIRFGSPRVSSHPIRFGSPQIRSRSPRIWRDLDVESQHSHEACYGSTYDESLSDLTDSLQYTPRRLAVYFHQDSQVRNRN